MSRGFERFFRAQPFKRDHRNHEECCDRPSEAREPAENGAGDPTGNLLQEALNHRDQGSNEQGNRGPGKDQFHPPSRSANALPDCRLSPVERFGSAGGERDGGKDANHGQQVGANDHKWQRAPRRADRDSNSGATAEEDDHRDDRREDRDDRESEQRLVGFHDSPTLF